MCHIPKAVHMMVDTNAANGDGAVRCVEVRRSEKVVRRKKEKKEKKKKKERKERGREKKGKQEKKIFLLSVLEQYFLTHNKVKTNMPSNSFETSFRFTHQKRKSA